MQESKRKSGLRFWNRALGIKAKRNTPRTRQPLTGVTLWGCVVGALLVLLGQVAFAHTGGEPLPTPTCSGLPAAAFYTDPDHTGVAITLDATMEATFNGYATESGRELVAVEPGDEEATGEGHSDFAYGRVTVPALTAGELTVAIENSAGDPDEPTNAILCRQQGTGYVKVDEDGITAYSAEHDRDDTAARQARAAATAAGEAVTAASEEDTTNADMVDAVAAARRALIAAESALATAGRDAISAIDAAIIGLDALDPVDTEAATTNALTAAQTQLTAAADSLQDTSHTDEHADGNFTAFIGSGVTEYIIVLAHSDSSLPMVEVGFAGLMGASALEQLIGTTGGVSTAATYTFRTNVAGLFKGDTSGAPATGTLESGSASVGVDTATGKVEITAPLLTTGEYTLTATHAGTSGGGNVTLAAWFRRSTALTVPTAMGTTTNGTLTANEVRYYHFDGALGILTLTAMQTRLMGADTQGVLYSQNGQLAMNMDKAGIVGFEIMLPIAVGAHILEVRGDTAQVAGSFTITGVLRGTSDGVAELAVTVADLQNASGMMPHYYIVTVPASGGWLQVRLSVQETSTLELDAELTGPDSQTVVNAAGAGLPNFATQVAAGQHLLKVTAPGATADATYTVTTNFIESVALTREQPMLDDAAAAAAQADCEAKEGTYDPDMQVCTIETEVRVTRPCPSTGGGGGGGSAASERTCRRYITAAVEEYQASLMVETDATGYLENPAPHGVRSGISVISGWACAANAVTIDIRDARGQAVERNLAVGYGTARPDTIGACDHDMATTGFGLTYNFNHLDSRHLHHQRLCRRREDRDGA